MKILVYRKGGSGKSTITAILAKIYAKKSCNVLEVDSDESKLHRQLGLEMAEDLMNHPGGKKNSGRKTNASISKRRHYHYF